MRRWSEIPRLYQYLIALGVMIGIGLRALEYLHNRSLWLDEAALAANVLPRPLWALFAAPLIYGQTAPPGWLVISKLITIVLGTSEFSLRLLSFVAGIALIPLLGWFLLEAVSTGAAVIGIAWVSVAFPLIFYSAEFRPYTLDAALATAFLVATCRFGGGVLTGRRAALLAIAGAVAIWVSNPVILVLGGCGIWLFIRQLVLHGQRAAIRCFAVGLVWVTSLAVAYPFSRPAVDSRDFIADFWSLGFAQPGFERFGPLWPVWMLWRAMRNPLGLPVPASVLAAAAFLIGVAALSRRSPWVAGLLGAVLGVAFMASLLNLYPLGGDAVFNPGRVLIYLTPVLIAFTTAALWPKSVALRLIGGGMALWFVLSAALSTARRLPSTVEDLRPAIAHLAENRQPGDIIYLYHSTRQVYEYYAPRFALDTVPSFGGGCSMNEPAKYLNDLNDMKGAERAWLLVGRHHMTPNFNEVAFIRGYLDTVGRRISSFEADSAGAYLYDLSSWDDRAGSAYPLPRFDALSPFPCFGPMAFPSPSP